MLQCLTTASPPNGPFPAVSAASLNGFTRNEAAWRKLWIHGTEYVCNKCPCASSRADADALDAVYDGDLYKMSKSLRSKKFFFHGTKI